MVGTSSRSSPPTRRIIRRGQALSGERLSEPVDIDNTPPVLHAVASPQSGGTANRVVFDVDDATGKIKRGDFSLDGAPWTPLFPDDGIADSGHEQYSVVLPALGAGNIRLACVPLMAVGTSVH